MMIMAGHGMPAVDILNASHKGQHVYVAACCCCAGQSAVVQSATVLQ